MVPSWLRGFVASWLLLFLSSAALADTPRELITRGNEHFQAGRYAEALEAYNQVEEADGQPLAPELLHDRAAAHFKLGQLDEARELWVRAAGLKDEAFEAAARYNLGNCDYADALQALQGQNGGAALELLDRAVDQYRDALRLDPTLTDARANLELAARLKQQIEEQAEQQPQSQPTPQQQPDRQEQQQGESASQPSSQPSESGEPQEQSEQQTDEQQQDDSPQQPTTQPETQPTPQTQPAPQPQAEPSPDEERAEQEQPQLVPIELTKEEAERLLQLIRDAERQRRAILQAREQARYKGADKDW
jgi:Ca-activated chloride channel family protein